jgi:hypothetical protein
VQLPVAVVEVVVLIHLGLSVEGVLAAAVLVARVLAAMELQILAVVAVVVETLPMAAQAVPA